MCWPFHWCVTNQTTFKENKISNILFLLQLQTLVAREGGSGSRVPAVPPRGEEHSLWQHSEGDSNFEGGASKHGTGVDERENRTPASLQQTRTGVQRTPGGGGHLFLSLPFSLSLSLSRCPPPFLSLMSASFCVTLIHMSLWFSHSVSLCVSLSLAHNIIIFFIITAVVSVVTIVLCVAYWHVD